MTGILTTSISAATRVNPVTHTILEGSLPTYTGSSLAVGTALVSAVDSRAIFAPP